MEFFILYLHNKYLVAILIPKSSIKFEYIPMQKVLYFNNLFYINDLYMYMCLSRDKLGTKIGVKNAKKNKYRH